MPQPGAGRPEQLRPADGRLGLGPVLQLADARPERLPVRDGCLGLGQVLQLADARAHRVLRCGDGRFGPYAIVCGVGKLAARLLKLYPLLTNITEPRGHS